MIRARMNVGCPALRAARAVHVSRNVAARAEPDPKNPEPVEAPKSDSAQAVVEAEKPSSDEEKYELISVGEALKVGEGELPAVAGASLGLFLRAGTGALVQGYSPSVSEKTEGKYTIGGAGGRVLYETSTAISSFKRPAEPIVLYEFDACPFCKKVREMVSFLDLDVLFYPTPQNGPTFRPEAIAKGGKSMFPYMEDPNTGVSMYESDDIIKYLAETYGDGTVPLTLRLGAGTAITAGLSGLGRFGRGGRYSPAKMPEQPLVLWAYEPSPFCRLVRERLVELELPHIFKSCARGSAKRQEVFDKYGKFQVPLLEDPNRKVALFESSVIVKYLNETYSLDSVPATAESPAETPAPVAETASPATPPAAAEAPAETPATPPTPPATEGSSEEKK